MKRIRVHAAKRMNIELDGLVYEYGNDSSVRLAETDNRNWQYSPELL